MYKGIYVGLSGAILRNSQIDVTAQNLANINTPGYKRDRLSFENYLVSSGAGSAPMYPEARNMAIIGKEATDLGPGEVFHTGNTLDLAIMGDGYFTVETPRGEAYTRKGAFKLDNTGTIVTSEGYRVLSESGPVSIPEGGTISVQNDGTVIVDGSQTGRLRIVGLEGAAKMGGGLFSGSPVASDATVEQGALENSNVDAFREMIDLVQAMRVYETNHKLIQTFDNIASKAANELGRA